MMKREIKDNKIVGELIKTENWQPIISNIIKNVDGTSRNYIKKFLKNHRYKLTFEIEEEEEDDATVHNDTNY